MCSLPPVASLDFGRCVRWSGGEEGTGVRVAPVSGEWWPGGLLLLLAVHRLLASSLIWSAGRSHHMLVEPERGKNEEGRSPIGWCTLEQGYHAILLFDCTNCWDLGARCIRRAKFRGHIAVARRSALDRGEQKEGEREREVYSSCDYMQQKFKTISSSFF